MRLTTLLHLALLALATSSAPIRTRADYEQGVIRNEPPPLPTNTSFTSTTSNAYALNVHASPPDNDLGGDHEHSEETNPVLPARALPKKPLNPKTTSKSPSRKKKPSTTTATTSSAQPISLVKIINTFDTAHTLDTGATSTSTSPLDGPAMNRSLIPLDLVLVQGSINSKPNPRLLKSHSEALAANVQTMVEWAVCGADEIRGGGAGGEYTVQHALLCVGAVVSKVLKAILQPVVKPQWDMVGLGPAPRTDLRMAIDGEAYTVIECKTLASLPVTSVDWIMNNLPNFKVVAWPEKPGKVLKYRTLIDSSSNVASGGNTSSERDKTILPFEQTLAQMFYYGTTTAALTNFDDWILLYRPDATSTTVTVMRTTNVKMYNRKEKSSILDIMLTVAMEGLRGKNKLKSWLA